MKKLLIPLRKGLALFLATYFFFATLALKSRFYVGDTLELLCPAGAFPFRVESITLADTGEQRDTVSVAGQRVIIPLPHPAAEGDFLRGPNRNHQGG